MNPELFKQLDGLQLQLTDDLDDDSDSLRSQDTQNTQSTHDTSMMSVQLSLKKNTSPRLVLERSALIQLGVCNLNNVLDCLQDMALQENAQIEDCLMGVIEALDKCLVSGNERYE